MIFNIALVATWRPGMLYNHEVSQVKIVQHRGEDVYKVTSKIATPNASKTAQRGLRAVNDKLLSTTVWRFQLDRKLCISENISEYLEMTEQEYKVK